MNKIKVPIKVCPECNSHLFKHEENIKEIYCKLCGLVLNAPYSPDFITPDFKLIHIVINVAEVVEEIKKERS